MTHMDNLRTSSGSVSQSQQRDSLDVGSGKFDDMTAKKSKSDAPAASASKTFFMEVKHFFTSLFGIRVSTPKPDRIDSPDTAIKSTLSDLTRKNVNLGDVMKGLGAITEQCEFSRPENRSTDGFSTPIIPQTLKDQIGQLNDMQLLRLYKNLSNNIQFTDPLMQCATELIMQFDDPTRENMTGAGKVKDMGHVGIAFAEEAVAELRARGYKVPDLKATHSDDLTTGMRNIVLKTMENGGDVDKAVNEVSRNALNESLKGSDLPSLDELPPQKQQVQYTPEEERVITERLKTSGLLKDN